MIVCRQTSSQKDLPVSDPRQFSADDTEKKVLFVTSSLDQLVHQFALRASVEQDRDETAFENCAENNTADTADTADTDVGALNQSKTRGVRRRRTPHAADQRSMDVMHTRYFSTFG